MKTSQVERDRARPGQRRLQDVLGDQVQDRAADDDGERRERPALGEGEDRRRDDREDQPEVGHEAQEERADRPQQRVVDAEDEQQDEKADRRSRG